MRGRRRARRALTQRHARLVKELGLQHPFSLSDLQSGMERYTGRPAQITAADLSSGSPSGIWFRKNGADFIFYERRTSPFHQAYIALHFAAHVLLNEPDRAVLDPLLTSAFNYAYVQLVLGDVRPSAVRDLEADGFAYAVLRSVGPGISRIAARRSLRRLEPLRRALLGAVPQAARASGETALPGATRRLYQTVIEIRDATLALSRYRDPEAAAAAETGRAAGLTGRDLAAAVEAAVLADAIQARRAGEPERTKPDDELFKALGPTADLASEVAWLTQLARAFVSHVKRRPVRRQRGSVD